MLGNTRPDILERSNTNRAFSIVRRSRRCIWRRYPGQTQRIEVDKRDVGKSQVAPGIMELRGAAAEVLTVLILCALLQEKRLKNKGRKHS
jgi:hypothetical protein